MNKRGSKTKLLWQNSEYRKRMSDAHKGIKMPPFTQEHKDKIRNYLLGKKRPKEVGENISKAKMGKKAPWQIGENNSQWKGGRTSLKSRIKKTIEYRQWRSDIFTRDNYVCQICFVRGGKLEADHIKAFSLIMDENNIKTEQEALDCVELWNLNNGRTLCRACHFKTPNYGRPNKKILC